MAVFPEKLLSDEQLASISAAATKVHNEQRRRDQPDREGLAVKIRKLIDEQKQLLNQISERALAGRPSLTALDDMVDEKEKERLVLLDTLEAAKSSPHYKPISPAPPSVVRSAFRALITAKGGVLNKDGQFTDFVRRMISRVVVSPSGDGKSADLAVYGQVVAILASLEAWESIRRPSGRKLQRASSSGLPRAASGTQRRSWNMSTVSIGSFQKHIIGGNVTSVGGCGGRI